MITKHITSLYLFPGTQELIWKTDKNLAEQNIKVNVKFLTIKGSLFK